MGRMTHTEDSRRGTEISLLEASTTYRAQVSQTRSLENHFQDFGAHPALCNLYPIWQPKNNPIDAEH